jgi:hypothetical protein
VPQTGLRSLSPAQRALQPHIIASASGEAPGAECMQYPRVTSISGPSSLVVRHILHILLCLVISNRTGRSRAPRYPSREPICLTEWSCYRVALHLQPEQNLLISSRTARRALPRLQGAVVSRGCSAAVILEIFLPAGSEQNPRAMVSTNGCS